MHNERKITQDLYWIGGNDRRIALFENVFPVPRGVSYNAYLLMDEKTVLLDTVDRAVSGVFFENLDHLLAGRPLNYVVVNHMEPDHAATLGELKLRHPEVTIVCGAKSKTMISQYFTFDTTEGVTLVKEGDTLTTGRHTLTFVMAPMVHWPEVMVTYDTTDKILFSADAFGTFGALGGSLFADEVPFEAEWLSDARRYYTNIVGKYGTQVQALLGKAAGLDISMICPLHGPIWRSNISWFVEKYQRWSTYTPETEGVAVFYASVYGDTENAASILAGLLADAGVKDVRMFDVSVTHPSEIVAEAFRVSHLVFASTTYNAGIFCNMETAITDIVAHNLQNRTIALIENGTWAATSGKLMAELLGKLKNCTILEQKLSIKSALKADQMATLQDMAAAIVSTMPSMKPAEPAAAAKNDQTALFKLSYGLFVLTAREGDKDNGCIVNTVSQLTDKPKRITVAVNKANYTHDMILRTGLFNASILTEGAPFDLFKYYGFQSGRDVNKFEGTDMPRTQNGLVYLTGFTNAVISGKVESAIDCGTHTLFIATVEEAITLSAERSVTYQYYFDHIKPQPAPKPSQKKGFVCKICGYIYEGDTLPEDFVCPLCKHGAEDFEPLK